MITVLRSEPDGDGGYYIQFTDTGQGITAYIHATAVQVDELETHHRRKRGAPVANLHAARDAMRNPTVSDVDTIEAWRVAYEELVDDIVHLRVSGLRHDTPHEVQENVRATGNIPSNWRRNPAADGFTRFRERST